MAQIWNCINHVVKDKNTRSLFGHQILVTKIFAMNCVCFM